MRWYVLKGDRSIEGRRKGVFFGEADSYPRVWGMEAKLASISTGGVGDFKDVFHRLASAGAKK